MAFIPADKTAQVQCVYTQDNQPCENVYWVLGTAEWTHATLAELAANVKDWATTIGLPLQATNVALQKVIATDWSAENGPQDIYTTGLPADGTHTGFALPNNCTVAIAHRTDLRGRSFRGRTYWIGLSEAVVSDNTVNAGFIPSLVTAMTDLQAAVAGVNSGVLVVASFRHNNAPRTAAVLTPITSFTVDQDMDSQRRRLPGHNRHR